jgi:predicted restriction endonuclease
VWVVIMVGFSIRDINTYEFRKAIKDKQGYKCHVCGDKHFAHNLQIAHIKDKARYKNKPKSFFLYNLKALCRNCHGNYDDFKKFTSKPLNSWSDYNNLLIILKRNAQKKKKPVKKKTSRKTPKKTTKRKTAKDKTTCKPSDAPTKGP